MQEPKQEVKRTYDVADGKLVVKTTVNAEVQLSAEDLKSAIQQLQATIANMKRQRRQLKTQLDALDNQLEAAKKQLDEILETVSVYEEMIGPLNGNGESEDVREE